jgi:hypothetical protein
MVVRLRPALSFTASACDKQKVRPLESRAPVRILAHVSPSHAVLRGRPAPAPSGRTTGVTDWSGASVAYTYDKRGLVTKCEE